MNAKSEILNRRRAGILLHPTSLPGTPGNGDLGPHAFRFLDFLADCGISIWQMLPLGPPHEDLSPYQTQSVHAANPLLISLDQLIKIGWLTSDSHPMSEHELEQELQKLAQQGWYQNDASVREISQLLQQRNLQEEFALFSLPEAAIRYRLARLKQSRVGFEKRASTNDKTAYNNFITQQQHWLDDYALFRALQAEHIKKLQTQCLTALKEIHEQSTLIARLEELKKQAGWWGWSAELRDRQPQALAAARQRLARVIEQHRFEQFIFYRQWQELKQYAHERGIYLFGDIPIFVAQDSVDVWADQNSFLLDAVGQPTVVAGVPPDYFSATGQRWGNPHYNWESMQANGFQWWIARLKTAEWLFDIARVDHFRGFEAYWAIPAHCETAIEGEWVKAPGEALFEKLQQIGTLPLVAEDLGIITDEVRQLRDRFGFPGMKILHFAFDSGPDNPYLPQNHIENCIVYTGTHDNDTTLGWFNKLTDHQRQIVCNNIHASRQEMPWSLINTAYASVAKLAVIPLQDFLALDSEHRMNIPGTATGNWRWRFEWSQFRPGLNEKIRDIVQSHGRNKC
jgi:4-alpha-glucanotransferase